MEKKAENVPLKKPSYALHVERSRKKNQMAQFSIKVNLKGQISPQANVSGQKEKAT